MTAFDIITVGTDTSGREVKMSRRMKAAFDEVCQRANVTPTIVQGAFMGSGGASASAGTHAESGCLDTRTWDLTAAQRDDVIRAARTIGWAVWYRTAAQGFDPHCHWVLPGEQPMDPDATAQVDMYERGFNGLASWGADDFWRPDPLPSYTYQPDTPPQEDDDMAAADIERIITTNREEHERTRQGLSALRQSEADRAKADAGRDRAILAAVNELPQTGLTREQVSKALETAQRRIQREVRP